MHCRPLPFRLLPHQSKLLLHFLDDYSSVSRFYPQPPKFESVLQSAKSLSYPADRRQALAKILRRQNAAFGAGAQTGNNLARLESGAVAIVTGQQVGLFTGPAFSIYKAVTAIKLAKEVTEAGIDAVPVFWMATEDHDLDEVRHTTFFSNGDLTKFELSPGEAAGASVGSIRLGKSVEELVDAAANLLSGESAALLADALRQSYRAEESYGSAFGKLFATLFAEEGLILIDPLDPNIHRLAAPVYGKAVENRDALNASLLNRGKELEESGFEAQVKVSTASALLFFSGSGERESINFTDSKFHSGESTWDSAELLSLTKSEPEKLSANAILRPVVQDFLLPTAASILGPSEISYYAQSEVLYRGILGRMPALLPRADFTLLDPKAQRLLDEYAIQVEDVWAGPQALKHRLRSANLPDPIAQQFAEDAAQINKILEKWGESVARVDPTLQSSVENSRKKIAFQLENLQQRVGQAYDRKNGILTSHEDFLNNLLYPRRALQSRELNILPFLARWGLSGLRKLEDHASSKNTGQHFIVPVS